MGDGPLIGAAAGECRECSACVRCCHARAIRVADGRCSIMADRCVACGLCVSACGSRAFMVRDDTDCVRELLASGRPVVAVLAGEFAAAMHPMGSAELEARLEALGFHAVENTVLGEEMVAAAYEVRHSHSDGIPVIRSSCPVVTAWVTRFRPALAGALAPVVPPYVAQARLVKALYPPGTAVVYVSPCYARKDESRDAEFEGAVDAAIDFLELRRMLEDALPPESDDDAGGGTVRPEPLKELSLSDGYPLSTLRSRDMTASDLRVVRGLVELDRLLAAIEAGETAPLVVDALNCEGCIDGPAVSPDVSLFAKRNIDATERECRPRPAVGSRELLRHLPSVDLVRRFHPAPASIPAYDDDEIDAILAEGEFADRAAALDCGACGYPTCVDQAIAIREGNATWDTCFPLQRRRFARDIDALEQSATRDSLTALSNRRDFSNRLAEELARHTRYGTPVSLLMLDLDGFKRTNDELGHVAGDAVLRATADVLRTSLRASDMSARYGGDEFAIILPGLHKTDAFAVAEKLRATIAGLRVMAGGGGEGRAIAVRASIGVSSANGPCSVIELIESADRALYQAKNSGRDQVRLAPG